VKSLRSLNLKRHDRGKVAFGGIDKGEIFEIITISIYTLVSIKNVLYIEELKYNLLIISQLCDSGYLVSFNNDTCIVSLFDG